MRQTAPPNSLPPPPPPTPATPSPHYYEVTEADYLTQRVHSYAHSLTTREQLRRTLSCCTRRRPPAHTAEEKAQDLTAQLDDDTTDPHGIHWPLLLSASSHLLAVLTETALVLRTALTQYAYVDLVTHPIPPYLHSRSPYPSSQPSSHLFSSTLHPYSYIHSRPAAWYRDDLLAVAVRDDSVHIYDIDPVLLDKEGAPHTSVRLHFTFSLPSSQSPLEQGSGVSLLGRGNKAYPTIAGMVWRSAACHKNPSGTCPHLLVLTYDGALHHVHVPTPPPPFVALHHSTPSRVAFDTRVPPHAPPTSAHSRSASIAGTAKGATESQLSPATLNAVLRKRFELQHIRAASSSSPSTSSPGSPAEAEDKRGEVLTFTAIKSRHGPLSPAPLTSSDDSTDEAEALQRMRGGGLKRRKQPLDAAPVSQPSPSDPPADDGTPLAFTAIAYDPHTDQLVVSSISLSPDRSPQLSYWRVKDQTPQPFLHVFTSPYLPPSIAPHPHPRPTPFTRVLHQLWKRVKVTAGAAPSDDVKPYEPHPQ